MELRVVVAVAWRALVEAVYCRVTWEVRLVGHRIWARLAMLVNIFFIRSKFCGGLTAAFWW